MKIRQGEIRSCSILTRSPEDTGSTDPYNEPLLDGQEKIELPVQGPKYAEPEHAKNVHGESKLRIPAVCGKGLRASEVHRSKGILKAEAIQQ